MLNHTGFHKNGNNSNWTKDKVICKSSFTWSGVTSKAHQGQAHGQKLPITSLIFPTLAFRNFVQSIENSLYSSSTITTLALDLEPEPIDTCLLLTPKTCYLRRTKS
jgi:hypothetical protein